MTLPHSLPFLSLQMHQLWVGWPAAFPGALPCPFCNCTLLLDCKSRWPAPSKPTGSQRRSFLSWESEPRTECCGPLEVELSDTFLLNIFIYLILPISNVFNQWPWTQGIARKMTYNTLTYFWGLLQKMFPNVLSQWITFWLWCKTGDNTKEYMSTKCEEALGQEQMLGGPTQGLQVCLGSLPINSHFLPEEEAAQWGWDEGGGTAFNSNFTERVSANLFPQWILSNSQWSTRS